LSAELTKRTPSDCFFLPILFTGIKKNIIWSGFSFSKKFLHSRTLSCFNRRNCCEKSYIYRFKPSPQTINKIRQSANYLLWQYTGKDKINIHRIRNINQKYTEYDRSLQSCASYSETNLVSHQEFGQVKWLQPHCSYFSADLTIKLFLVVLIFLPNFSVYPQHWMRVVRGRVWGLASNIILFVSYIIRPWLCIRGNHHSMKTQWNQKRWENYVPGSSDSVVYHHVL